MGKAGVVAFAKTRLRWNEAQRAMADAVANVSDGLRALVETEEFQDDPRSQESDTPALIDALAARLPRVEQLSGAIDDALDADGASPDARRKRVAAALKAIAAYEAELAAFDELRAYQRHGRRLVPDAEPDRRLARRTEECAVLGRRQPRRSAERTAA
ncbi:hypothetical protein AB5I41_09170 [Sphingomonas sp. MMS24-JH45]